MNTKAILCQLCEEGDRAFDEGMFRRATHRYFQALDIATRQKDLEKIARLRFNLGASTKNMALTDYENGLCTRAKAREVLETASSWMYSAARFYTVPEEARECVAEAMKCHL